MAKWVQLDLFTGEPILPAAPCDDKQERIAKTTRLALQVQLSIARLDKLTDTLKKVSELCVSITGIAYPISLEERRRTHQQKRQQETKRAVATETEKKKRERPKQKPKRRKATEKQLQAFRNVAPKKERDYE